MKHTWTLYEMTLDGKAAWGFRRRDELEDMAAVVAMLAEMGGSVVEAINSPYCTSRTVLIGEVALLIDHDSWGISYSARDERDVASVRDLMQSLEARLILNAAGCDG